MRNFKRVMALVITLVMLVPMCVVSTNAAAGDPVGSNWTTFAAKYYSGRMSTRLSMGFTFTETENGGLHVTIPNGKTGQYGTRPMDRSAKMPVTKFTTTEKVALDGLTATVELDDTFTFNSGVGSSVVMLWTDKLPASEDTIFDTYDVTDPVTGEVKQEYVFGAANSHDLTYSNGFRAMVEQGTKGLMILVNNHYSKYDKSQIASSVYVYYFDGEFVDPNDGYGYRWTFTARNYIEETQIGDYTGIVQRYEKIDCSNGITFSVNADEEHGYIVSVNGNEYYLGSKIAYFPNDTGSIRREDELNLTEKYTTSMTYAREDIKMLNLVDIVDGGYLTVGSVGNNVATTEDSYTVRSINGIPAAQYNGEANTHTCNSEIIDSNEATCGEKGNVVLKCSECGAVSCEETVINHHYEKEVVDPTCTTEGCAIYTCSFCGDSYVTDETDALGHKYDSVVTMPTCVSKGYTTYTCSLCGDSYVTDETDALGHTAADAVVENEAAATCTAEGSFDNVVYCAVCKVELTRETVTVAALGHNYEVVDVVAPTCTVNGYTVYACVCGDSYTADPVDAAGHPYYANVTDPTCTEGGYTTYICDVCGDTYVADYTEATGHNYEVVDVVAPTCTVNGYTVYACVCGDSYTADPVDAAGHPYHAEVTDPTCTEVGYTTHICDVCGDTYVADYTEAIGHNYEIVDVVAPTCTVNGYTVYACVCGDSYTADPVDAAGHPYYTNVTDPTCTEGGYTTYVCDVCGDTYVADYTDALGHTEIVIESVAPTCTEDGSSEGKYCKNCGECLTAPEILPAKGHNYIITDVLKPSTCSETGLIMYMCECGYYEFETIAKIPHLFENYKYNEDATCISDGTKTALCSYGCETSDTVVAEGTMIPHMFGEYVFNNDATCTSDGTKTASCIYDCGVTDTVVAVGTKLDHSYTPEITLEPTCTSTGIETYTCACGDTYTVVLEKTEHNYVANVILEPTCSSTGVVLYMCSCRAYYREILPYVEHNGEWKITVQPTSNSLGERVKVCDYCNKTKREVISTLGKFMLSTSNYSVIIDNENTISTIRFASGVYTTASDIKNATDCITLNSSVIAKNTKDGMLSYALKNGGIYTFWFKMNDNSEYIMTVDLTVMNQEIVHDGVTMTVKNLYGVKDYFIAKGEHTTYSDVKANSVVQITKNKIGTKHDYTYILSEPGVYTVCVRYDDTTRAHEFITVELTVTEPTFTANGLQLKVGNLDGVKVIRTAYGDYNTPGEIKRAEGTRAFTAKTIAKSGEEYTIQYRENGLVSVAVVYNNGYEVIYKYNVTKKVPVMTQEGSTVTFTDLDDLKVIRYAEGVYTTSNAIKNASGSKSIQGYKLTEDSFSVTLTPGTYTFCVQYDDESYNYYTVVVK